MTSTQRFLSNDRNQFNGAVLLASSVMPITDAVLEKPLARGGSARVGVTGTYTGQEEAEYEIEILDNTVSIPLISQPVFAGAGTGAITNLAYTGTAQTFTVKLADLGQVLTAAGTDLEGVSIVARTPGDAGNLIRLHVDLSGLTYTATNFSLIRPLSAGGDGIEGAEYDWDTKVMGADEQIPASAHRLVFGEDTSTVYTQYKQYQDGKWLYHFEPAIRAEVPTGTRIRFVTGGRTITVSNGTATEAYPNIVTLFDLLSAIQTGSALVKVDGVVANDRAPGGMASRDLQTRTDAHCLPPTGEGSQYVKGAMSGYYANPGAATELVEARCWAVSSKDSPQAGTGRELWQIKGSVSGVVAEAYQTGALFAGANFGFQIPVKLPDGFGVPRGRFSVSGISYAGRLAEEVSPPICVASMTLGPDAIDQQLTLVYKERPSGDCACSAMAAPDLSGKKCLIGTTLTTTGGGLMDAPQIGRLSRLEAWHRDAVESNTTIAYTELDTSWQDVELFHLARDAFSSCLDDLYTVGTLSWAAWAATTVITRYTIIQIGDDRLQATTAGTTGVSAPTVPATVGDTITDGTVTWTYLGKTPEIMWDEALDSVQTHLQPLFGNGTDGYTTYEYIVYPPTPPFLPGLDAFTFTSGQIHPSGTVINNGVIAISLNAEMTVGATTPQFNHINPVTGLPLLIGATTPVTYANPSLSGTIVAYLTAGSPGSTVQVPTVHPATGGADLDNSWIGRIQNSGYSYSVEDFAQRYTASMDAIRAAAGISKKADASTVAGDGCWRDSGTAFWWEITGQNGAYAPAFTNEPYFSSRDAGEGYFATHEFAFQINVKCEASLKEGDTITLSIGNAGWPSTYQVGDTIYLPIIAAQDLYLAGGKDGDNIQTWHVDGSVSGAFPPHLLDMDAPLPYSQSGLQFTITPGGIPFEAGDFYKFTVEGGHYRWRKDSGAWSGSSAIPATSVSLSDGLTAQFTTGAAPSFATGDLYRFRALQPYALSNAFNPDPESWRWDDINAWLQADMGVVKTIDALAIAFHSLPAGCIMSLQGGMDGIVWDWNETIPWSAATITHLFVAKTARYLRFNVALADDAAIGWIWAGEAISTEFSAECLLAHDYQIERGAGLNPSAAYLGATRSGEISWELLRDPDMQKLMPMLDYLKQNDDQPMILIPQSTRPEEAYPMRVNIDRIDAEEDGGYQSDQGRERRYTMRWELAGVVA